jgi:hypothetical protein
MKALCFSKMLVRAYQTIPCNKPEHQSHIQLYRIEIPDSGLIQEEQQNERDTHHCEST